MSAHFLAAAAGTLLAAVACGMLAMRCARAPNAAVAAWAVAALGLTVALAAQALGYHTKFDAITFRAMEVGSQVVAPLALGLGLVEVAARGLAARFAARLILSALAFVSIVVLATDPLSSATFTKNWPSPTVYYQPIPNGLLKYLLGPVTVLVALIGAGTAAARQGRDPAWRAAFPPAALAALAMLVLAVPGISTLVNVSVPLTSAFVLLCILAAGLTWLAGMQAGRLRLDAMRGGADPARRGPAASGDFDSVADDEYGTYRGNGSRRGGDPDYGGTAGGQAAYPGEPGYSDQGGYPGQAGYAGHGDYRDSGYPDQDGYGGGYPDQPGYGDDARYPEHSGYPEGAAYPEHAGYPDEAQFAEQAGYPDDPRYLEQAGYPDGGRYPEHDPYQDGGQFPEQAGYPEDAGYRDAAGPAAADRTQALYGQIAIYTLLEDRVDDFDHLTSQVVRQVRTHEPGTLVYIVHAVPSAPMQRILYEVYRDRDAFEEHKRQPYVASFEADRRPYVLATNVIELGLQQAKVAPMPSVTDLLTDTGFDLLNDTGFGHPGYGPRHTPRHGGGMPDGGPGSRQL